MHGTMASVPSAWEQDVRLWGEGVARESCALAPIHRCQMPWAECTGAENDSDIFMTGECIGGAYVKDRRAKNAQVPRSLPSECEPTA